MTKDSPLYFALHLDGEGGAARMEWPEISEALPAKGATWTHLRRNHAEAGRWLREVAKLPDEIVEALLAEETRPRVLDTPKGLLINLRGVNLNPGAEPDDMISIRLWIEPARLISLTAYEMRSVHDARTELLEKRGAKDPYALFVNICGHLIDRIGPVIDELDEWVDTLEEKALTAPQYEFRNQLADLRRQAIRMRRYLAPQREVLNYLFSDRLKCWSEPLRWQLRETYDQAMRYIEDLDEARDRATVTHEELMGRLSDQMNQTMYRLAMVATVFLPLSLLTGLLGINVDGMPGAGEGHHPYAFWGVCVLLVALGVGEWWYFKKKKLL